MADVMIDPDTGEEIVEVLDDKRVENQDDLNIDNTDTSTSGNDERLRQGDETDDEGDDEGDGNDQGTDAEREAIRARRREERKHRKQAQREREDTLRRELSARDTIINEMRQKLDQIERRNNGSELAQIETAKQQTAQAYNYYKDQIRIATEAGNGAGVADATERMLQAQRKFDELNTYERAHRQRAETPQPLDPRLQNNAQQWMQKNSWYDPSGKDMDSRIVSVIDQSLAQEGWNPSTPEYWDELSARVNKHLPHRTARANVAPTKPRAVVAGSGREGGSGSKTSQNSYTLSAERVQALKDAGLWEDPKQRAEAVKRFRDYDKQNKG